MKRLAMVLGVFLMALGIGWWISGVAVFAAPKVPSGTISGPNEADPGLGDSITFSDTVSNLPGWADPRIQVICYQNNAVVYGEAGPAWQVFLLGGASSDWLNDTPPADRESPAHCVADLYYWRFNPSQQFNWLASTEFDAAGL